MNKVLEKSIHKAIIKRINMIDGFYVWKRKADDHNIGHADITGVGRNGIRIEFEVKRPGGVITKLQEAWIDKMKKLGCIAGIVTSPDEAAQIIVKYYAYVKRHNQ